MPTQKVMSLAETVRDRIGSALEASAEHDAERVTVHMNGSCAVLKGTVRSWTEHEDIEAAALASPGVGSVDNQLALLVKARPVTTPAAGRVQHHPSSRKQEEEQSAPSSMREKVAQLLRRLALVASLTSIWLFSSEPWGLDVYQLLVFTAPGALLGLGAGWAAHGSMRADWTWKSARHDAFIGAATLPPMIGFVVALEGQTRPQNLLFGFVYVAWATLIGGAAASLARCLTTRRI